MKAYIYERYGSPNVLELKEIPTPAPSPDQVLIKLHAVSVNAYDWHLLSADFFLVRLAAGLFHPKPTIPGADIAGRVEAVGSQVTQFQPGQEVFGDIGSGGFAEYARARESLLALKPANLTFEEAAAAPMAALTALQSLRDAGQIQAGQKVLIYGAGGGVGTFSVQLAKHFGAQVTAVCGSRNLDLARSLGADQVIDYTREDFSKNGSRYDLILAVNGFRSILNYRRALNPGGVCLVVGGKLPQILQALALGPLVSRLGSQKVRMFLAKITQADLITIAGMLEAGTLRPVIDRRFPFSQAGETLAYLGTGHARGKVVISL